jgi:hypothetical protein
MMAKLYLERIPVTSKHFPARVAGHSASKTRVNALSFPATPIVMVQCLILGVAGTSPATTRLYKVIQAAR